ncbi:MULTISPECIES: DUF1778 domain-containing protein [Roseobacteraceae]|jgi:uncharacterized protein (DUF1778 family)|uniref:type II toxin-antitoxin system TacA family antitoxin n=1 Tax=Roseobacteraceae TaxID=2854170 RepID=UPI0007C3A9AF|nr:MULTISPECIES: DUF1778 domain-containing protein [unclassified Sulfitobacter]KZY04202.1 hypothetical protein A3721_16875 [Sulfitobacter sp. HI0023]KZZ67407.1 hypothetical protein A3764_15000 [Sulfitobacter sp. HI0129]|tara:strand:+ start:1889 stop:2203 length:315 start_codon:yes stop_codon:yes gene_type:complete
MLAFEDSTVAVDEPKSARLEARTQPSVKDAISRAATLSGVEVSSFVVSAAYKAAQTTIEAHKLTVLESEADRAAFFGALENPPKPNNRLKQAFALRETLIANAD